MDNEIICTSCSEEYSDRNIPRLMVNCGHTYCEQCLLGFISETDSGLIATCPEDQEQISIPEKKATCFPKNLALMKIIDSKKINQSFKDSLIDVSKITKNSDPHEEDDSSELIGFISMNNNEMDSNKNGSFDREKSNNNNNNNNSKFQICPSHKKPMDIVCINDLTKICANCAIFGQHKGHDFKSLEEIEIMKKEYSASLIKIIEQKDELEKKTSSPEMTKEFLQILSNRKIQLKKKIVQAYNKIMNKVDERKKVVVKQLDQLSRTSEQEIKKLIKLDDMKLKQFKKWEQKSLKQVRLLDEDDLQAKLILLFEGISIDGDIVQEGNHLLQQLQEKEMDNLQEVEEILEGMDCSINQSLLNEVDGYVKVFLKEEKNHKPQQNLKKNQLLLPSEQRNNEKQQKIQKIPQKKNNMKIVSTDKKIENEAKRQNESQFLIPTSTRPSDLQVQDDEEEDLLGGSGQIQFNRETILKEQSRPIAENQLLNSSFERKSFNYQQQQQSQEEGFYSRVSLPVTTKTTTNFGKPKINQNNGSMIRSNEQSFINEGKGEKKQQIKKLKKLTVPQKYEKIIQGIIQNSLELVDLTNAELGDSHISVISQGIDGSKVRTVKFIRNKLTDEGVARILPFLTNVASLNLSQNLLTENILDILQEHSHLLPNMRTVILSQNKIIERKHRSKIERVKKLGWTVSV